MSPFSPNMCKMKLLGSTKHYGFWIEYLFTVTAYYQSHTKYPENNFSMDNIFPKPIIEMIDHWFIDSFKKSSEFCFDSWASEWKQKLVMNGSISDKWNNTGAQLLRFTESPLYNIFSVRLSVQLHSVQMEFLSISFICRNTFTRANISSHFS